MNKFIETIDKQIEFNKGKNIILDQPDLFKFVDETINIIAETNNNLNPDLEIFLIDYATNKALEEFCRINQYYAFNSTSKSDLKCIYSDLFYEIREKKESIEQISKKHYFKLKEWLIKYNAFAEKTYANANQKVSAIACAEYSYNLQMDILKIDVEQMISPVLDIGCGKQGNLVHYLTSKGIEAYGIDRYKFNSEILHTFDWLEYDYGVEKWGTIISNLGFSNHFNNHNLRKDGNYIEYGKTFINILNSLKVGGSFHYAPDLPFIEIYLDTNKFKIMKHKISELDFKATIITKLHS